MASSAVFIVHTDDAVRDSVRFLLEAHGWDVRAFGSPQQLRENLDPKTRGCLVLDYNLPELTGLEFVEELRRRDIALPAILIGELCTPDLRIRAARANTVTVDSPAGIDLVEAVQAVAPIRRSL